MQIVRRKVSKWALSFYILAVVPAPMPDFALSPTNFGSQIETNPLHTAPSRLPDALTEELFEEAPIEPADLKPPKILTADEILKDADNRIHEDFSIPKGLEKRTAFWFDIYTKYGSEKHVIHHVLYPWIVFKVVDTTEINNSNLHRWTKYHKAKKYVRNETNKIRAALKRLSKRKSFRKLKGLEKELYQAMKAVKGPRRKVFREAAAHVRVQLGQRDFFLSGLESSAKYLPYMEQEFTAAGLPVELTRLPFVESSFNEKAQSKVGASGIWQIMPSTGRAYFYVNDLIDERNSPLKASLAAIAIFRSNYSQLKSWPLAVTAYNHGAAGIRRSLKAARATNLVQLINKYHDGSFKFASANFYTSFLAALHAERYHREIFSADEISRAVPREHRVFKLGSKIRPKRLAQLAGIDTETLLEYNLDLKNAIKKNGLLPRGFKVLLPPHAKDTLESSLGKNTKLIQEVSNISIDKRRRS